MQSYVLLKLSQGDVLLFIYVLRLDFINSPKGMFLAASETAFKCTLIDGKHGPNKLCIKGEVRVRQ